MSEEQALQVVGQGVACIEERDYQRTYWQLMQNIELFHEAQRRVVEAWFHDNYPQLRCRFVPAMSRQDGMISAGVATIVENYTDIPCPVGQIQEELDRYLERIETEAMSSSLPRIVIANATTEPG